MTVDIVSGFVFAFLVFMGWRSGALRQIVRVVGIAAVVVGVPFLSPVVRELIFGEPGRATPGIEVASIVVSGIIIYIAIALAGWVFVKMMRLVSSTLDALDRLGGATIGAVKAVILVYLFAVAVVFMEGPITEYDPDNELALQGGWVTGFVADHNVLAPWQFPDLDRLHRALRVGEQAAEAGVYEVVRDDKSAAELLRDERIAALIDDDQLMQWVRDDHYPMTLADERIRELLNDDDISRQLAQVDWRRLQGRIEEAGSGTQ